jgi:polysaccharide export outer membrane protein
MKQRRHVVCAIVLAAVGCCAAAPLWAQMGATEESEADDYTIKPGDLLTVSVWNEPDLAADVLVRPDGGVSFPLAGELLATDRSVESLRVEIQSRLSRYISEPVVTVAVREIGGSRIYVLGQVNRPGDFLLNRPIDVMQALSLAGGTTPYASLKDIVVLRRKGKQQVAIAFAYEEVMRGRGLEQNILLRNGDTVVVP